MPQISKIRIVNFQYNDGNRLIADELFDFEGENRVSSDVLIHLANGGGKSVLVQLMMQPVIPRAKVAGRRIESFFKKAADHCYVLTEWTLDGSSTKLMTGIAMAASDSANDTDTERGFQIKYYTFISSYQNYQGNYNIISLPLSRKEKGKFIPAAFDEVRNIARKSGGGLERYSSDDSMKWQERLSQYGIVQNEWRMIEELNSNEDGLSKYFSSLKSSDAVIDKLIIPRIEEKQSYTVSKDDSSLETMLISYAKQFSKQQDTIKERDILAGFNDMLTSAKTEAEELWKNSDSLEKCIEKLFAYTDALNVEIAKQREKAEQSEAQRTQLDEAIRHISWEKASAEYYLCKEAFEKETAVLNAAEEAKTEAKAKLEAAGKKLLLLECAHYFGQLKKLESQALAISEAIAEHENNSEAAGKLASLKYSAELAIQAELKRAVPQQEILSENKGSIEKAIEELNKEIRSLERTVETAKTAVTRAETTLNIKLSEADNIVEELGIGALRMLDGRYQEDELAAWKSGTQKKEKSVSDDIEAVKKKLQQLELRRDEIPQEIADMSSLIGDLQTELRAADDSLSEYRRIEECMQSVCKKYGLDFTLRYTEHADDYLEQQKIITRASIAEEIRKIEATKEAIAAVKRGTLHIPKLLTDHLDSTGIRYISVEKYIIAQQEKGNLSKDDCLSLLEKYPYAAYGVIIDTADKAAICLDADGQWLPAVLPVFTAEDIEIMLRGKGTEFASVAAYSKDYFHDNASYAAGIKDTLDKQYARKQQLEEREKTLVSDAEAVKEFSAYDEKWEERTLSQIAKLQGDIDGKQEKITALKSEQTDIRESIGKEQEQIKLLSEELSGIRSRLSAFDRLLVKLEEELSLEKAFYDAREKLSDLTHKYDLKKSEKDKSETKYKDVCAGLKEIEALTQSLLKGLETVSDSAQAEIIDGEWSALLSQYDTLLSAQNADLKRLNDDRNRLLGDISEKQKEIRKRDCLQEEYEALTYTEELETDAKTEKLICQSAYQAAEDNFSRAGRSQAKAEAAYEKAADSLKEFGGEALPFSEVGKAFDERIAEIRKDIEAVNIQIKTLAAAISRLEKAQVKAENVSEQYTRPVKYNSIELEADYTSQLNTVKEELRKLETAVASAERKVKEALKEMSLAYGAGSADVSRAISSMQELLSSGSIRGDRYFTLCEHMEANMHTVTLRISQIDTDLKEFHKTKGDLIRQCVIQGRQMYEGLKQLSANSRVKVQDRRRQMIKFDIPDAVDENIANAVIAAEIDKGTEEIAAKMTEDAYAESDVRKIAARIVGSRRLLRRYINTDSIVLRAYKIDRNPDNSGYRTWEQTQVNNSGAEKFVVYFAVILALMAYTRDAYESQDSKENRSVLILDNPFGPISSRHVLEPMFEISRNYNVQMICLTDISKSDIVTCFDLVIRAIVKQFALSSKEQLTHEGNELIEHGFYRADQISLF